MSHNIYLTLNMWLFLWDKFWVVCLPQGSFFFLDIKRNKPERSESMPTKKTTTKKI